MRTSLEAQPMFGSVLACASSLGEDLRLLWGEGRNCVKDCEKKSSCLKRFEIWYIAVLVMKAA